MHFCLHASGKPSRPLCVQVACSHCIRINCIQMWVELRGTTIICCGLPLSHMHLYRHSSYPISLYTYSFSDSVTQSSKCISFCILTVHGVLLKVVCRMCTKAFTAWETGQLLYVHVNNNDIYTFCLLGTMRVDILKVKRHKTVNYN